MKNYFFLPCAVWGESIRGWWWINGHEECLKGQKSPLS